MPLIYTTHSPEETFTLGESLGKSLKPGDSVLLFGPLGAGKTHFVKGLAKGLGLEQAIKSPTYAYVMKHKLPSGASFYHYDLYRLNPGEAVDSIGLEDSLAEPNTLHAIEWADRLGEHLPVPSVQVILSSHLDHHQIQIRFEDGQTPSPAHLDEFYKYWATPQHVRKHMSQVAKVALQIAQAYADVGEILNSEQLYMAAMLHDVARVCDFKTLDRQNFDEEITGAKWSRWVALREQFKGQHHPSIARDFLKAKGFVKTADLIYAHGSRVIVEEPEGLNALEAKILYYADKRVKHDQIVDLAERFRDGRERYGEGDGANQRLFEEVEKRTFELEGKLFKGLKIKPSTIE